jgi:hypothetical protein
LDVGLYVSVYPSVIKEKTFYWLFHHLILSYSARHHLYFSFWYETSIKIPTSSQPSNSAHQSNIKQLHNLLACVMCETIQEYSTEQKPANTVTPKVFCVSTEPAATDRLTEQYHRPQRGSKVGGATALAGAAAPQIKVNRLQ